MPMLKTISLFSCRSGHNKRRSTKATLFQCPPWNMWFFDFSGQCWVTGMWSMISNLYKTAIPQCHQNKNFKHRPTTQMLHKEVEWVLEGDTDDQYPLIFPFVHFEHNKNCSASTVGMHHPASFWPKRACKNTTMVIGHVGRPVLVLWLTGKMLFTCLETTTLDCVYVIKSKQRTPTRQLQKHNVGSPGFTNLVESSCAGVEIWNLFGMINCIGKRFFRFAGYALKNV